MGECEAVERSVRQKMKKKRKKERWVRSFGPSKR